MFTTDTQWCAIGSGWSPESWGFSNRLSPAEAGSGFLETLARPTEPTEPTEPTAEAVGYGPHLRSLMNFARVMTAKLAGLQDTTMANLAGLVETTIAKFAGFVRNDDGQTRRTLYK